MTDPNTVPREFAADDPPTTATSTRLSDGTLADTPLAGAPRYEADDVAVGDQQGSNGKGEQAKQSAQQVAGTAKDEAGAVASTAKEEAKNVASTAASQARNLAGELQGQVQTVTRDQRDRLAATLHEFSDELREMADASERHGMASELARQVATRGQDLASFLDRHEPTDLLHQTRQYARRRPGTFILGAVIAGVVAGRLTRGAAASHGVGPAASDGSKGGANGSSAPAVVDVDVPGTASDPWERPVGTFAQPDAAAPADPYAPSLDARDPYAPASSQRGGVAP